jgi:DNA invertase Pin-like site-specific DNA recombinase
MDFGYARVSTDEQNLDLQIDALMGVGIDPKNIYLDKVSGARAERKNLDLLLTKLREGDVLYV